PCGVRERSESGSASPQNGQSSSAARTWRVQPGQGRRGAIRDSRRASQPKAGREAPATGRRRRPSPKFSFPPSRLPALSSSGTRPSALTVSSLHDQLEVPEVEGQTRRVLDPRDALALTFTLHLERAVVAVGVVAGLAEETEARPRAARPADVGVVAGAAVAPEILDGAIARVAQRRAALPDVPEAVVADVAAGPRLGGQRGAALDRSVGLDAERRAARAARGHVPARHRPAQRALVGAEVADVVAWPDPHARLVAARLERGQQRE